MFCYTSQIYRLMKNVAIDVTYIEKMLQFRFFFAIKECISHMTHMLTCIAVVFILIFDYQFSLVVQYVDRLEVAVWVSTSRLNRP
jgi:hypothetical protein